MELMMTTTRRRRRRRRFALPTVNCNDGDIQVLDSGGEGGGKT